MARTGMLTILILTLAAVAPAGDYAFRKSWKKSGRPPDGEMTAVVKPKAKQLWGGHFSGITVDR